MDPFATLGIPRTFELDVAAVERRHRALSRALHPDKYAAAGASERREALSRAVEVNEAWRVVRDPIRRAEALFALAGIAVGETNEPKPSAALLMDILEAREALAEAKGAGDAARIAALKGDVEARARAVEDALRAGFAAAEGAARALAPILPKLGELRFYRRFLDEVSAIEDDLADLAAADAPRVNAR